MWLSWKGIILGCLLFVGIAHCFDERIKVPRTDKRNKFEMNNKPIGAWESELRVTKWLPKLKLPSLYLSYGVFVSASSWAISRLSKPAGIIFGSSIAAKSLLTLLQLNFMGGITRIVEKEMKGRPATQEIDALIQEVAKASNLKYKVKTFLIPSKIKNAFAIGNPNTRGDRGAAVAVTQGLVDSLSKDELRAVVAHEIGHLYNSDTTVNLHLIAMLTGFFAAFEVGKEFFNRSLRIEEEVDRLQKAARRREEALRTTRKSVDRDVKYAELVAELKDKQNDLAVSQTVGRLLSVVGIGASVLGMLFQRAASRSAEYRADAHSAVLYGHTDMMHALQKISKEEEEKEGGGGGAFSSSGASLFGSHHSSLFSVSSTALGAICIVNKPMLPKWIDGFGGSLKAAFSTVMNAFSSHPTLEKRLTALQNIRRRK
jgi:Zn-dependent protease with chaperone function